MLRAYETGVVTTLPAIILVQPAGIEPASTVLQTAAMTTSAKVALNLLGVLYGERSHTIAFTEQCADHYTNNTPNKSIGPLEKNRTFVYRLSADCSSH